MRLLFFGLSRADSYNKKLARLGSFIVEANGIPATFGELGDYPMPIYNGDLEAAEGQPENAHKFKELIAAHAGISSPARSTTRQSRRCSRTPSTGLVTSGRRADGAFRSCKTRVFALGSWSNGGMGGLRSLTTVRQVLNSARGACPARLRGAARQDAYDEDGHLVNKDSQEI